MAQARLSEKNTRPDFQKESPLPHGMLAYYACLRSPHGHAPLDGPHTAETRAASGRTGRAFTTFDRIF